ncbi:MAG: hypothetical protein GY750_01450, partial [Lentisphaerae bacterium]|nr:hypothetical protein [Lentisphaerota bacterium]
AEQATAALAPFLEILGGSGSIGEKLSGLWTEAQPHLAEFKDRFVQWVKDITPPLLREAGRMATKFGRWIKDQAPEWAAQLVEWGKAFVEWVVPMIPPALEKLVEFATAAADWMLETGLPLLVEKLVEWGKAFVEWVVPMIPPLLLELGKILVSLGEWVLTSAVPKIAALGVDLAGAMLGFIKNDVLPALPGLLADVLGAIVDWATGPALTKIGEVASDIGSALGDGISAAFKGGLNALIDAWNGLEFTTPSVEAFGRTIGGFTIGTPDIARFGADGGSAGGAGSVPRLHDGGMFRTSNPSGEGLAMLQDGERVLSRSEVAAPGRKQTLELNLRLNGRDLQKILLEGDARGFRMAV